MRTTHQRCSATLPLATEAQKASESVRTLRIALRLAGRADGGRMHVSSPTPASAQQHAMWTTVRSTG